MDEYCILATGVGAMLGTGIGAAIGYSLNHFVASRFLDMERHINIYRKGSLQSTTMSGIGGLVLGAHIGYNTIPFLESLLYIG